MSDLEQALEALHFVDQADDLVSGLHQKQFRESIKIVRAALLSQKPTHYAVIDEHGEIAHSAKINNIEDALKQCNLFLTMMRQGEIGHDFKDWTVKGVTVHE